MPSGSKVTASIFDPTVAWATWTPTWTNLTVGSGTVVARYMLIGKAVLWRLKFTYGTGSAVGTNPNFTLPTNTGPGYASDDLFGNGQALDAAIQTYVVGVFHNGGNTARFNGVSATSPFTFASGDSLQAYGTYEAA